MGTNGKLEHTYILMLENKKYTKMKNRKFIYLKNSFILGLLLSLASVVKEKFRMKVDFQLSPEVLSMALLAD
jgi:hypothetical protein